MSILASGSGNFKYKKLCVSENSKQQMYTKVQRIIGRLGLKMYYELYLDIMNVREDNTRSKGEKCYIQRMPLWKYYKESNRDKTEFKNRLAEVHDLTPAIGVKILIARFRSCIEKERKDFSSYTGSTKEFLLCLNDLRGELKKREKNTGDKKIDLEEYSKGKEHISRYKYDCEIMHTEINNLLEVKSKGLYFVCRIWKILRDVK
eukprot:snap_masked-scaffold_3-processed-gene-0.36-mRNA-1 protein AED:1.00 eAED:1.00 QI:0/0/0/0/1/1/2/0/203